MSGRVGHHNLTCLSTTNNEETKNNDNMNNDYMNNILHEQQHESGVRGTEFLEDFRKIEG